MVSLQHNERVKHLDLSQNEFSEEGGQQLGRGMGICLKFLNYTQFKKVQHRVLISSKHRLLCIPMKSFFNKNFQE